MPRPAVATIDSRSDRDMPALRDALDPPTMRKYLRRCLAAFGREPFQIRAIRLMRHKHGRRCVIEYELEFAGHSVTVLGKLRAKGLDRRTYRLYRKLWRSDLRSGGLDLPQPLGALADLGMWLQRKVTGTPATTLFGSPNAEVLAREIAVAAFRLHQAGPLPQRSHTAADELAILQDRLAQVALKRPRLEMRLGRLKAVCERLAKSLPPIDPQLIHRDFYGDHVLVADERLYLLDFDLCCQGDPAVDVGNFVAHMSEQSLREHGNAEALAAEEEALKERYVELAGAAVRERIDIYAALTLARHVHISTLIAARRPYTEALLELSLERAHALERQRSQPRPLVTRSATSSYTRSRQYNRYGGKEIR
ncbi:MAG TPA: aminoglycoside phosphotransferase family protein, partial [Woeseiaceae bacterium]